jgi:hypothetical protein
MTLSLRFGATSMREAAALYGAISGFSGRKLSETPRILNELLPCGVLAIDWRAEVPSKEMMD